jgi:ribonuclease HI
MHTVTIHTDGGSRGNPGPAAVGVVIALHDQAILHKRFIGHTTNNVAEYQAVIDAISLLKEKRSEQWQQCQFFLDSELVVKQLTGVYKIKDGHLQQLAASVNQGLQELAIPSTFSHIFREANKQADSLVNQALDQELHA